jgi:16S rRNA (uracil1498-N3)-methyltransferase
MGNFTVAAKRLTTMARFFLAKEKIHGDRALVDGQELAHLSRVLRLRAGDSVVVIDDSGWEHEAVIDSLSSTRGELKILRSNETQRESTLLVTLAVGLTKGEKIDFVVEKATELGVQRIIPFASNYAVPKLDSDKIIKRTERWRKIAVSAAKQCGRARVPEILPLCDYSRLVSQPWPQSLKLIFWERESDQSLQRVYENHRKTKAVLVAVGPEGGFTVEEAEAARARGFEPVRIGRRILRAETAAMVALALVQFLWGDLK